MTENKRYTIENEDGTICIRDNIRRKYIFTFVCEDIDMEEGMLEECEKVVNCLNQTWEQTQRFEKYNKEYIEDNEKLKRENMELNAKLNLITKDYRGLQRLIKEIMEPTATYKGQDVYLDIGENKQCFYEETFVCYYCAYFSSYFLGCSLRGEEQYKKALELGVVKKDD